MASEMLSIDGMSRNKQLIHGGKYMKLINKHIGILVLLVIGAGCSSDTYRTKTQSNVSDKETKTQNLDYGRSAVLHFTKGSSNLTKNEKNKLKDVVAKIGVDNIKRIEIASWSDKDFPITGLDLPKVDRNLADDRASSIDNFLKDSLGVSVFRIRTYNMAETSNWIARMFRTDEAELKSVFAKQEDAPMARDDYNVILSEGGPSRVVMVFIRK